MKLIINSSMGTEASVKRELFRLGIADAKAIDGKIAVEGDYEMLAKLCVWLRCADRVMIELGSFSALTFDELFDGVSKIDFSVYLKKFTRVMMNGNCVNSKLMAIKSCGGVIKKSIMNNLERTYGTSSEVGETVTIYFTIVNDVCTIYLDACGNGLHKRGYRPITVTAPLKETLACSMIDLSVYSAKKPLADLFCGSGTIAIEAAMIAKNIAPGLNRTFDFVKFNNYPDGLLEKVKQEAMAQELDVVPDIYACDIDSKSVEIAKLSAEKAGVLKYINFEVKDMRDFSSNKEYGIIISNPPYGERLGDKASAQKLARSFAKMFGKLKNWSCYILTDDKDFEQAMGRKSDKKRKLFNGKIECNYYSFMGRKPEKH